MVRTPSCDKSGLRKGTWTLEEDMKLTAYVTRYGSWNWSQIPKFAGLARCGKSCRLRWLNYLRPDLKRGNFTQEEEDIIIGLHTKLGNRWSAIASNLPGRTDNEIKNHWHTTLKKRFLKKPITKEEAKSSKSKDSESKPEMDYLVLNNNCTFKVPHHPAFSQISDSTTIPLSPLSSNIESSSITLDHTAAASNDDLVPEDDDFAFLDAYTEPVIESFWTEPCVAEISYPTNETARDHGNNNHDFQSPEYSIEIPDASMLMSSQPALENDFAFLDSQVEPLIENFWSEPYMADTSHNIPSELLYEYSSTVNDADLWSQSNLYDEHIN